MPSISRNIPNDSEMARKILKRLELRVRASEKEINKKYAKWAQAEDTALAYIPERDADALRRANREGGIPEYTTIQIPYTYAVLMAAHTYLTSVFMGRSPLFQFAGRHGEAEQSVQAVEALTAYQMNVGRMLVPIYIWLYDALKYGVGVGSIYWEDREEAVTTITMQQEVDGLGQPTGRQVKLQETRHGVTYSGNRFKNIQPQDFLWDTRFPAWDFQSGEFCGTRFALTWNDVIRREKAGYYMNIDEITDKSTGDRGGAFGSSLERTESTDPRWATYDLNEEDRESAGKPKRHPSMVKGYEVHIELIPNEWGLGSSDFPEKWVFTATADFKTLMGAQPLGAYHCRFPFSVLCLEPEAYGITSRGFPEILEPVQQTVDWLINSHFYNIRSAMNNMFVVDPSRLVMKDILSPKPGKLIRLRQEAYGTDPKLAITQFQTQDVTQNHLRDLQLMLGIGERTVGINDQIMGMLNAGGRKTATEVRTSTSFGVNRLKTISEFFSVSGFDPVAQLIVQNSQQYYDGEKMFKIAGDQMMGANSLMMVTPESIMGYYDFEAIDGTLPIDRFAQMNIWMQMFSQLRAYPQLMMQYDLTKIFEFIAMLGGLKNIRQFRLQVMPNGAMAQQAQLGNSIPMDGGSAPPPIEATPPGATSPEPGQMPGMGATG